MAQLARSALLGVALAALPARGDDLERRFFDFTPVSADNPVVATIDDGRINIPLSELRAYREAEKLNAIANSADLAQKRAVLDDLITEYLHVDAALRAGVAESPGFLRQMEATRTMVLTDFLSLRAQQAAPIADTDAASELAEKLFEAADIVVSNEAYDLLKRAAQAVDDVSGLRDEAVPRLHAIMDATPEAVLVRFEGRTIALRQLLILYAGLPEEKRPPLQTPAGLIDLIKPLILPQLMAIEAEKRGIEREPEFRHKLIQNRNALLRFHAHGQIDRQANERLRAPDLGEKLRAYHRRYQAFYLMSDGAGGQRPATFEESAGQVEGDYSVDVREKLLAERARELRQGRAITVDDTVLARL